MAEIFPFINMSEKAGNFLAYFWQFFQNALEIMGNIYENRSIKVTEYKQMGYIQKYNWQKFTDARKSTEEIIKITNDTATKIYDLKHQTEELKLHELKQKTGELK